MLLLTIFTENMLMKTKIDISPNYATNKQIIGYFPKLYLYSEDGLGFICISKFIIPLF